MFIRNSLKKKRGRKKKRNEHNRLRNKILNFRTTPEEREKIEARIALSGLEKQDYFIQSCLYNKVICYGNVRVFEEIQNRLLSIENELKHITVTEDVSADTLENLRMILELYAYLNFEEKEEHEMVWGKEQKEEIATIRERTLQLKLSDADVDRIWHKAGESNLTVSELLEQFIGDLVGGTYSNGSDERDIADQWFQRCWFGMFPSYTFLHYLLSWELTETVLTNWEIYTCLQDDLTNRTDMSEEEIADMRIEMQSAYEEVEEIHQEYKKHDKDGIGKSLEEDIKSVIKWKSDKEEMFG